MTEAEAPELIVCDSSFVGAVAQRRTRPDRVAHWDTAVLARIDGARAAISIITLAEARAGYVEGDFGAARIEREERRLQAFAQLPFDDDVLAEWARLRPAARARGLTVGDNDLWIASTATSCFVGRSEPGVAVGLLSRRRAVLRRPPRSRQLSQSSGLSGATLESNQPTLGLPARIAALFFTDRRKGKESRRGRRVQPDLFEAPGDHPSRSLPRRGSRGR